MDADLTEPVTTAPVTSAPVTIEERGADGSLLLRSSMAGGLLHGPLEQFGIGGRPTMTAHFDTGRLHGAMAIYGEDGVLVQRSSYRRGLPHGLIETFAHGRRVAAQTMSDGVASGPSLSFDESGQMTARLHLLAGQLDGEAQFFHEGRMVRSAHYRAGLLEGQSADFDADGQVVQRCTYRANLLHGAVRRYWPDGLVMEEVFYHDGVTLGPPARFDQQGKRIGAPEAPPALIERLKRMVRGD
jgi:antitoxin component YwqK of YwqJK toxin-antitoxin module